MRSTVPQAAMEVDLMGRLASATTAQTHPVAEAVINHDLPGEYCITLLPVPLSSLGTYSALRPLSIGVSLIRFLVVPLGGRPMAIHHPRCHRWTCGDQTTSHTKKAAGVKS